MRTIADFARARRGGVSIVTAASFVCVVGFAGFATDVGAFYLEARRLQGSADLAAMAAMQSPTQAQAAAEATVRANDWPQDTRVRVTRGVYAADRRVRPEARFRTAGEGQNAVRVELEARTPLYFSGLFLPDGRVTLRRRATAAQRQLASFQIGTRLLSLNGGIANAALSGLTGSTVSLSVMDYNALLRADVDLLTYVDALRTRLDLEAASFDRTLAAEAEAGVALNALADVLDESDARAAQAMRTLAERADGELEDGLGDVIDLGPYAAHDALQHSQSTRIAVKAMDLATAILEVAGGDRQVRLDLGAGVPGLAATQVWLAIGERPNNSPWLSVTDTGDITIRTAQMRLYIEARIGAGQLGQLRTPLLIELASAQARLQAIECQRGSRPARVTLSVAPSVGAAHLADIDVSQLDNFRTAPRIRPASLLRTPLLQVEGHSRIQLGGERWQNVPFSGADIERGVVKSVSTRDIAAASISSLLAQSDLSVRAAGLSLSTGAVTAQLRSVLSSAARPLDELVNGLTDLLGVRLGEADVRVNGVRCGGAALVA